jgi:hypothetical protein
VGNKKGNTVTRSSALQRTKQPGVYRKANRYVAVYRVDGRQQKQYVATFDEARAIKLTRDAQARELRRGAMLHSYVLSWAEGHSGSGHDSVRQQTREEYRRLLVTYALRYFDHDVRLEDLSRRSLQGFISWLTHCPGRNGNLADRSVRNALAPLRLSLEAAAAEGRMDSVILRALVLPRRRGGRRPIVHCASEPRRRRDRRLAANAKETRSVRPEPLVRVIAANRLNYNALVYCPSRRFSRVSRLLP